MFLNAFENKMLVQKKEGLYSIILEKWLIFTCATSQKQCNTKSHLKSVSTYKTSPLALLVINQKCP